MTEQTGTYEVTHKDLAGLRNTTLLPYDQGWQQPTPDEVRTALELAGQVFNKNKLTGSEAGRLTGVDARTIRKWTAPENEANHRPIPYAAWRLLIERAGIVEKLNPIIKQDHVAE